MSNTPAQLLGELDPTAVANATQQALESLFRTGLDKDLVERVVDCRLPLQMWTRFGGDRIEVYDAHNNLLGKFHITVALEPIL